MGFTPHPYAGWTDYQEQVKKYYEEVQKSTDEQSNAGNEGASTGAGAEQDQGKDVYQENSTQE